MPEALIATGRLDELDSVGRLSMSVIGLAFKPPPPLRRLRRGAAVHDRLAQPVQRPCRGEHRAGAPRCAPHAQLSVGRAHQDSAFVKLFQDAFPKEAADAAASNDMTQLVNDVTVLRATATFMRTVVTRNTPFDRFVAGDDEALTASQRRGARLFFTKAANGGAGCFTCHSGPQFNKQVNDPDLAGIGQFVEENFFNIGIGDHPVQALNALAAGRLDPAKLGKDGFPYHAEDIGRQLVTQNPDHAFKFRVLTLRQLKDGRNFMHNASFSKVRDVVEYFNAGIPKIPPPEQRTPSRPASPILGGLVPRTVWACRKTKSTMSPTS